MHSYGVRGLGKPVERFTVDGMILTPVEVEMAILPAMMYKNEESNNSIHHPMHCMVTSMFG